MGVGRHHAASADERVGLEPGHQIRKHRLDLLDGQGNADHAGGTHQDEVGFDAERRGRRRPHAPRRLDPGLARADVGDPAVDHDRLQPTTSNDLPPHDDRRADDVIAGEFGRGCCRNLRMEKRHVRPIGLEARMRGRAAEATRQNGRIEKRHGHRREEIGWEHGRERPEATVGSLSFLPADTPGSGTPSGGGAHAISATGC